MPTQRVLVVLASPACLLAVAPTASARTERLAASLKLVSEESQTRCSYYWVLSFAKRKGALSYSVVVDQPAFRRSIPVSAGGGDKSPLEAPQNVYRVDVGGGPRPRSAQTSRSRAPTSACA